MLNEWQKWCRLCAKENGYDINVLVKDENISNLSEIIQKLFSIEIISTDEFSTTICLDCHKFISDVIIFSERSSRVQSMYSELKFSSDLGTVWVDLIALRKQFGISSNNDIKFISQHTETNNLNSNLCNKNMPVKTASENYNNLCTSSIENFQNIDENNDENIIEIDYLDEDLLEIKYEHRDNNDNIKINKNCSKNDVITKKSEYECDICQKKFIREKNYHYHMKLNHSEKEYIMFSCDKCNKKFKSKKRLTNHLETHMPTDMKLMYSCPFCDKSFLKKIYLHSHVRAIHENIKPYICEQCGKGFGTCGALKEHKYTHIDDTPYQCLKCPKKFKNKARLKTHTDTHNDTMYVCTTCGLQLNTRRTLLMHMVVHSDQKKHKCNFCGNEYKRAKALKNHLILHTGLRPYSCPFCDKTFANGSNCRSHKKKSHPNELAALEASGEKPIVTKIPKLEQLKSVSLGEISQISKHEIWNNDIIQTNFNEQQNCIIQQSNFDSGLF